MATSQLMPKQNLKIKGSIVDINHWLNQILTTFDSMNKELSYGFCLIDTFPDCFAFNIVKYQDAKVKTTHLRNLDNIYRMSKDNLNTSFHHKYKC